MQRKLHLVRAMISGTVFMFDTGELEYSDATIANVRFNIDRGFSLP